LEAREGRVLAIIATTRELAEMTWNIFDQGGPYINPGWYLFPGQKKSGN